MNGPDCTIDRTITIPQRAIDRIANGPIMGRCFCVAVDLGWPELRLTEAQILANAVAAANGQHSPYPDPNIVTIEIPWPVPSR